MADVAVIIAAYERPGWLEAALRSVRASADRAAELGIATEILVVDDASPSPDVQCAAERAGVGYLRLAGHAGFIAARNAGLDATESTYQCFFDTDDVMAPEFLAAHVERAEAGFDVVAGSYWLADRDLAAARPVVLEEASLGSLREGRITVNDQALVRRAALEGIRFDPALRECACMAVWLELAARGARFSRLAEPSWWYRQHEAQMSRHLPPEDAGRRAGILARYAAVPA